MFGTADSGGLGNGTVFAINTNGTGFTTLYSFAGGTDGAYPEARLLLSGGTLYGTANGAGNYGNGTVFAVNTDGTGFASLYSFSATDTNGFNGDGANPQAGLILSGNVLYGTAAYGGSLGYGTVFGLSLGSASVSVPQLTITHSATNVVLAWPANATGFTLQSTTNLAPPAVWLTNSPAPVVVNGQNTVTNPITSSRRFFRLSQ